MKVFIDGKYYDGRAAKISVFDHGLLYGDGVFEGIRAYHGRVFKLREHIDRLFCSAKAILLHIPMSHAHLMHAVVEACRKNKIHDGYIRLVVTRGIGTLGLSPSRCKNPSVIIIADKIQLYPPALYQKGMEIVTVPTVRNLHSALNPAIKSLNYLNNILAKIEANHAGCEEAVMLNAGGFRGRMHRRQFVHREKGRAADAAAFGGRAVRHHAGGGHGTGRGGGVGGVRAEPDALRFVQRGRVFSDGHGRGNRAGGED